MSLQGNIINLLKQLSCYGRTIKPSIKEFTNAKLLFELPFFEKSIKAKIRQLLPINYYKSNLFISSPSKSTR